MKVRNPRLRLVVGRHGRLLAAALAILAVASFVGAGAVYSDQPTERVSQTVDEQSVRTTTSSSAVVTGNDTLWPEGTVLRNQPVYLSNASRVVNLTATTSVDGAEAVRVTHEVVVSIRVLRGDQAFYARNRTVASNTGEGSTVTTTATIDVAHLRERVSNVSTRVGQAGLVTVDVVVHTHYETVPGSSAGYEGNDTLRTAVGLEPNAYTIGQPSTASDHARQVTTDVTRPREWSTIWGLVLAGLVGLVGAGGILYQRPASIDLGKARHDMHRRRYEEWISPGIIPMGIQQQFIELTSLEDVVDVAIDTQERVVYDQRRELFAVISENVVYYFSPGGSWMETAFPGMSSGPGPGGDGVGTGVGGGDGLGGGPGDADSDFGEPGGGDGMGAGFEDAFGDFPGEGDDGDADEAPED